MPAEIRLQHRRPSPQRFHLRLGILMVRGEGCIAVLAAAIVTLAALALSIR